MTDSKPLAVVTGASSGIGFELANQFAQNGFDLLITSEITSEDEGLTSAAAQLQAASAHVQSVQADLSTYDGVEQLYAAIMATGTPVLSAAALNTGVGRGGAFVSRPTLPTSSVLPDKLKAAGHRQMAEPGSGE